MGEINPESGTCLSLRMGNTLRLILFNFFIIPATFFSIMLKGNFMSRSRFNKLRFNIGLLPKLWSYFKQIWKERRSYNFYSFYGHWVTSFFTLSERYCRQYSIFMSLLLGQSRLICQNIQTTTFASKIAQIGVWFLFNSFISSGKSSFVYCIAYATSVSLWITTIDSINTTEGNSKCNSQSSCNSTQPLELSVSQFFEVFL